MSNALPRRLLFLSVLAFLAVPARPAEEMKYAPDVPAPDPALLAKRWPAHWIAPPNVSLADYGVFLFRKNFTLSAKPEKFVVHVSADNRYRLFVNGQSVCYGPQRGDLLHWHYDSIDLAPYLRAGDNLMAIQVWNYAADRPFAITSLRSELIVQGNDSATQSANTDAGWRVRVDPAFSPIPVSGERLRTFIVVGPGDRLDAAKHPWGWEQPGFDDGSWTTARVMDPGLPNGYGTGVERWLVPRSIPLMEETAQRLATVRRVTGASPPPEGFLAGGASWTIPPGTTARLLLDQGFETNAFPQLVVSGGRGAKITLAYAEALFDANFAKGNRNDIEGRELHGIEDEFLPDGGAQRMFTTLDFRTYRYVELRVTTGTEPLTIDDIRGVATGYPLHENAKFASDDPTLSRIWQTGWRTARLCAGETYFDCPYYERMQYIGDTRIQALISLYVSGDDRLVRNAITLFDQSRIPEGLTQSRYPSRSLQIINTFSLFWIAMVHDYWMHRDDAAFVAARLRGIENVLAWFKDRVDPQSGLLGPLPYWTFVDWPDQWPWNPAQDIGGEPPGAHTGGSSIVTLQYAMALDQAADLFRASGEDEKAGDYAKKAAALRAATMRACWDDRRQLLADTPDKREFSQHANALAILSGAVTGGAARDLITRTLNDRTLVQGTLYFRFYLLRALKSAGLGDQYLDQLGPWRAMLDRGLTTFAEREDPTRSDCHAWSASPVYEFLATVCGVEPAAPGFRTVRIAPHLGKLNHAEGLIPHPAGPIQVKFTRDGAKLHAAIELPPGLSGVLLWGQSSVPLHPGFQQFDL
jgi:alpha-L-rhamnosidase